MANILVTGGLGFIGSHLVDRLMLEHNSFDIDVVDDLSTGKWENISEVGGIYKIVDICNIFDEKGLAFDYDIIYHLAGVSRIQPSLKDPDRTIEVNVQGTSRICELARLTGAKLIYAGSCTRYEDTFLSPYSFSKWAGEEVCRMYHKVYGVPMAIARFHNVYGKRQMETGDFATVIGIFERQYKAGQPLTITGRGTQKRDFVHVDDVVDGMIKMAENPLGNTYDLASGKSYSINEIAQMFNTEVEYIPARAGEDDVVFADIRDSIRDLNYKPKGDIRTYINGLL